MVNRARWILALVGSLLLAHADAATYPHIAFEPESPRFAAATKEYQEIWATEGARIDAALAQATGLPMEDGPIRAIVYNGISSSGYPGWPMRMRADLARDTKRATLVHELGHRLQVGVAGDEDEHEVLFLWIYDVWTTLWGKQFADQQVIVERARRGPYPRAWDAALALNATERAEKFRRLKDRK